MNAGSFMRMALAAAEDAAARGEVPVGAVVVARPSGAVLAVAGNRVEAERDPTAHAEILAIRAAAQQQDSPRLESCDIYVTLEPCAMCAAAIALARIGRLFFGAYDPKGGGVEHGARVFERETCHHRPEVVGGIEATAAGTLLQHFFRARRSPQREQDSMYVNNR